MMPFDKEKENGTVNNNNNFYNHSLHQMYNSGNTPYNTSPASSPSVGNYAAMPMYNQNNNRYPMLQQTTEAVSSPGATPHLARQLTYAQISRQSSSPHHHARAAAAMARNTPVASTVTITDPNDPNKMFANKTGGGGNGGATGGGGVKEEQQQQQDNVWTSLDMGGMGLKNIASTICNYKFLTALYINHNNLTYLMPSLSQLNNLKILDASGNKLSMLPPEMGLLCNLRELLLFDNNLVSLPTEFGNLYQLETLGLEGNPLQADLKNILIKDGTQALVMSLRENAPGNYLWRVTLQVYLITLFCSGYASSSSRMASS